MYRISVGNLTIFNFKFIKRNLVTQQFVITGIMVFKGVSAENAVDMDATVEGEEAKVAFSSKYLMDVLGVLSKDEVSIEVTTPSSPGVFRPVNSDSYVHVIMPMFVQW